MALSLCWIWDFVCKKVGKNGRGQDRSEIFVSSGFLLAIPTDQMLENNKCPFFFGSINDGMLGGWRCHSTLGIIGKTFQVVLESLLPNEWVRKLEAEAQACLGKTVKLESFAKDGVLMYRVCVHIYVDVIQCVKPIGRKYL